MRPFPCPTFRVLISFLCLLAHAVAAETYVPGQTYFGRSNYIEYIAGDLPIIISAPHGGTLTPSELPNRTNCTSCAGWDFSTATDTNTQDLARRIRTEIQNRTGHSPHIIICRLARTKIDCNRAIEEGAQHDPNTQQAWTEFQDYIEAAKSEVTARHGRGFYADLHGHGHSIQRLEIGYLLTSSQLGLSDATLNGSATYENSSSIRELSQFALPSFATLLRGATSFGSLCENAGFPSVPSLSTPNPGSDPYFNGGYNTRRHGSRDGGTISGLQIECNYTGVRDTSANRTAFAQALAEVLERYFALHYGVRLRQCVPSVWPGAGGSWNTAANWLGGVLPVSSNYVVFAGNGGLVNHNLAALSADNGVLASLVFSNSAGGAYTLSGNSLAIIGGITNHSAFTQTINNAITVLGAQTISAESGALTFGGNLTNSGTRLSVSADANITISGVISGSGGLTKSGGGLLALTAPNTYSGHTTNLAGTVSLNGTSTFGDGTGLLVLAGGNVLSRNTRSGNPLLNPIVMTADTVIYGDGVLNNSLRVFPLNGTLIGTGGELLIRNAATNPSVSGNEFRLRLGGGGFSFAQPIIIGSTNDLAGYSSSLELYNGVAAGSQSFSGEISGPGPLLKNSSGAGGLTILSGANTYVGGTIVNNGLLLINNTTGSGTGTGDVSVNANGTLGGKGIIAGKVTVTGTLSPGDGTGVLTLNGGLDMSAGGTFAWDLATLATDGAGTNYDHLVVNGGTLLLGGSSKLRVVVGTGALPPVESEPFWQAIQIWPLISVSGTASNPGGTTFAEIENAHTSAGTFSAFTDATGSVFLKFTPVNALTPPLIRATVEGAGAGATLHWSATAGQTYEIQFKDNLNLPGWSVLDTIVATDTVASFVDSSAPVAQRFYRVVIRP